MTNQRIKIAKIFIISLKIAIGSVMAILIASGLHLEFAPSAGIITLLSVVSTKWETVKLSVARILTFFAIVAIAFTILPLVGNEWIAYGILVFFTVLFSRLLGIESTISTNAVIGTHFLTTGNYSISFIYNEFMLVLIGTSLAIILNMINGNGEQKKKLLRDIQYVEEKLRMILEGIADYLHSKEKESELNIWQEISALEAHLAFSIDLAYEYQGNTFPSHPGYFIQYFEMRSRQCNILHNLHNEINKIRVFPVQAEMIAGYMSYMRNYVLEHNVPDMQEQELQRLFKIMKEEPLPVTRDEFESRAILYHVLMDLEDFLLYKRSFIESMTEKQRKIYWKPGRK